MPVSIRRSVSLAASLAALCTSSAQADDILNYFGYCTSGAIRTCASIQVETIALSPASLGDPATLVVIRVSNIQGRLGFESSDGVLGGLITAVGITHPELEGVVFPAAGYPNAELEGGATRVGSPDGLWEARNSPGDGNIGGLVEFSVSTQTAEGGILGASPSNANPSNYFRTDADAEFVVFRFTTTNSWEASDAQIAWKAVAIGPDDLSLECRTVDESGEHFCTAVPEPFSLALLGTGLAGLGGFGLLRRRLRVVELADD